MMYSFSKLGDAVHIKGSDRDEGHWAYPFIHLSSSKWCKGTTVPFIIKKPMIPINSHINHHSYFIKKPIIPIKNPISASSRKACALPHPQATKGASGHVSFLDFWSLKSCKDSPLTILLF